MRKTYVLVLALSLGIVGWIVYALWPVPVQRPPEYDDKRPIAMADSVWLDELTWMEVRDMVAAGKTTAIIPTGGIEEAGPYLAIGKHNYVVRAACDAIARKLGNALCAPVVAFVPQGSIDPPTGMMRYPGTIGVRDSTYAALVTDIAHSLMQHGFKHIVLISDNGRNQAALREIAESLSSRWKRQTASVHYIAEFKDRGALKQWTASTFGWQEVREGIHDDPRVSTVIMTIDPALVRIKQREAIGKVSVNGISLLPVTNAVEMGKRIVEFRADAAVAAIRRRTAEAAGSAR
jgi:creatinine amidohydrolase/Fe(II)-dependent formamide hydrolase-like protein